MNHFPFWYLDFEAYQIYNSFYVKEIAILKSDKTHCYTYYISHPFINVPRTYEFKRQQSQQLDWSFGEHSFDRVIAEIKSKIGSDKVIFGTRLNSYDNAKFLYLKGYLPQLLDQPYEVGYQMTNCIADKCGINHNFCARQRVHEHRYYDFCINALSSLFHVSQSQNF